MADYINDIDQLEQEIAEYRSQFRKSSDTLAQLSQIQTKFEALFSSYQDLENKYRELQEYINDSKIISSEIQNESKNALEALATAKQAFDEYLSTLKQDLSKGIAKIEEDLKENFKSIESELDTNLEKFRHQTFKGLEELDFKIQNLRKAYENQQNTMQSNSIQFEESLRANKKDFDNKLIELEQDLTLNAETKCQSLEKQITWIWMTFGLISIVMASLLFLEINSKEGQTNLPTSPPLVAPEG